MNFSTALKGFLATIIGALVIAATVFVVALIAPAIGALLGLIVGWVFSGTSTAFLAALGLQTLSMWQFGAMAAFVGGLLNFGKKG